MSAILPLPDGKILIAGSFTGGVARLLADGSRDTTFDAGAGPPSGSSINLLRLLPSGKILVAGSFASFSGLPRANLCRLNADGSPDATFGTAGSGPSGTVVDVAIQPDGHLLIGGSFSSVGGQSQPYLARLDADGMLDTDFRPGSSSTVRSIAALANGRFLVGGDFTRVNNIDRKYLALLHADGTPDATFDSSTGANYTVNRLLVQPGGKILAGGSFVTIGGVAAKSLARLAAPTAETKAVAASVSPAIAGAGTVLRLTGSNFSNLTGIDFPGGVAADFTVISETELDVKVPAGAATGRLILKSVYGDSPSPPFHMLPSSPGQADPYFNVGTGASGTAFGLAGDASGRILAAGQFTSISGASRAGIARLNPDGTIDSSFTPLSNSTDPRIMVVQPDGKILVGGYGIDHGSHSLARLNPDGSIDNTFSCNLDYYVNAIVIRPDGRILAGGSFFTPRLAGLTASGAADSSFNVGSGANNTVNAIRHLPDGRILVGGNFSTFNGASAKGITRLMPDGTVDPTFKVTGSGVSGSVAAIDVRPDGAILIGGSFNSINGNYNLKYLARLGPDGEVDSTYAPTPDRAVLALEPAPDGRIAVGGDFTSISGSSRDRVAILHADGAVVEEFNTIGGPNSTVEALLWQADGSLVIGGGFSEIGQLPPRRIARLYGDGGATRPAISSIAPAIAAAGEIVTIFGSNLASLTAAEFAGRVSATVQPVSETSVRLVVPAGAMSGPIVLKNAYGQAVSRTIFRLRTSPLPVLDPLPPGAVSPAQLVTIAGRNFFDLTQVRIGVVAAAFTVVSATELTFTVPENAVTGRVILTSPGGVATSADDLAVTKAPPVLTSATTASGTVGVSFRFTLTATKSPASFTAAPLPAGLSLDPASGVVSGIPTADGNFTVAISATNAGGTASGSLAIEIAAPPPPAVSSITPAFVPAGGKFLVSGSYLTLTTGVTVGGVAADFTVLSDGKLSVTLPAGASGLVETTTAQGTATGTRTVAPWDFQNGAQISAYGSNAAGERYPPGLWTDLIAISAGGYHSLALRAGGAVIGWGGNWVGQATPPADLAPAIAISAGGFHSLALQADGTVAAWGRDDEGQCAGAASMEKIAAIAAGSYHSLALRRNGTVAAWGSNASGQTSVPQGLGGVVAIAAGGDFSLALKSDGTVIGWGANSFGQTDVPAAATGIVAISAGRTHAVALKSDGTVVCWGADWTGQSTPPVGLSDVVEISAGDDHTTARRADSSIAAWGANWAGQSNVPAGIADASAISSGGDHTLVLRGAAPAGSPALLVTGTPGQPLSFTPNVTNGPFQFSAEHLPVGLVIDAATGVISGTPTRGGDRLVTIVARNTNGISRQNIRFFLGPYIVGWGENVPGPIPQNLGNVVKVAAGPTHCLALRADGTVAAWGNNTYGKATIPTGLTNVIDIAADVDYSLALKSDGTVIGWGNASYFHFPPGGSPPMATGFLSLSARDGLATGLNYKGRTQTLISRDYSYHSGAELIASVTLAADFRFFDDSAALDRGGNLIVRVSSGKPSVSGFTALAAISQGIPGRGLFSPFMAIRSNGQLYEIRPSYPYSGVDTLLRPETVNAVEIAGGENFALVRNTDGTAMPLAITTDPGNSYYRDIPPAPLPDEPLVDVTAVAALGRYALAVKSPVPAADIISSRVLVARKGQPFTHQLAAVGPAVTWSAALLPPGLSLDSTTGKITGSPTTIGVANFLVIARRTAALQTQVISLKTTDGAPPMDIALDAAIVVEDLPAGTPVGTLTTVDPTSGDTFTYSLVAGAGSTDNAKFKIAGNQLLTTTPLDFETTPLASVRIRVTDSGSNDFEKVFQIQVTDVSTDDDDKDGLTQAEELALGTDPQFRDTDGDGASDGQENLAGTDPLSVTSRPARYVACWGNNSSGQCNVPADLGPVIAVAAGTVHTLALRADGTVTAWGANSSGQCTIPEDLSGVTAIAATDGTSFALRTDGTVAAWGSNSYNMITDTAALTDVIEISARGSRFAALLADGQVRVLGWDSNGILNIPASAVGTVSIAIGDGFMLALNRDGRTVAWGADYEGKSSGPAARRDLVSLAAGTYLSLAIDADGSVRTFGRSYETSATLLANLGPATAIAACDSNGLAINAAGALAVWGSSSYGLLDVPPGLGPVRAISGGKYHIATIISDDPLGSFLTTSLTATAGLPFSRQLAYSGNADSFRAAFLPPGLSFDPATATLSGTSTDSGIFNIRITAENGFQRVTGIVQLKFEAPRRFEEWAAVHFSAADPRANPLADPDFDGLANLIEYALARDPLATDPAPPAVLSTISVAGIAHLALTYERRANLPDIQCTVEVSGDLVHWQPAAATVSIILHGETETVTVRDNVPAAPGPRFMRLRVVK